MTLEGAEGRIWCSKIGWQTVPCSWSIDGEGKHNTTACAHLCVCLCVCVVEPSQVTPSSAAQRRAQRRLTRVDNRYHSGLSSVLTTHCFTGSCYISQIKLSVLTLYQLLIELTDTWLRGCKNWPALFPGRMSYKATKPRLALSVVYLSIFYCIVVYWGPLLCIVSFRCCVFCLLVVLAKLSLLAKWLARK